MIFGFTCPHCGLADLEADIKVTAAGTPGRYGLPEDSYPAEGAEWEFDGDCICEPFTDEAGKVLGCGHKFTEDELSELFEEEIQDKIADQESDWNYPD